MVWRSFVDEVELIVKDNALPAASSGAPKSATDALNMDAASGETNVSVSGSVSFAGVCVSGEFLCDPGSRWLAAFPKRSLKSQT